MRLFIMPPPYSSERAHRLVTTSVHCAYSALVFESRQCHPYCRWSSHSSITPRRINRVGPDGYAVWWRWAIRERQKAREDFEAHWWIVALAIDGPKSLQCHCDAWAELTCSGDVLRLSVRFSAKVQRTSFY